MLEVFMREIIIALNTIKCDMSVNIAIRTNSFHADESEADESDQKPTDGRPALWSGPLS